MSMFGKNTATAGSYEVVAREGYRGSVGAATILIESIQNDLALFEGLIGRDFEEAAYMHEGAIEKVQAIQEASGTGMIDKIKQFLKGIWEKIKGLFNSFMAYFNGTVIRDNKKLVEKYKTELMKKDLSKFKFKARKNTGKGASGINKIEISELQKYEGYDALMGEDIADLEKVISEMGTSDFKDKAFSATLKSFGGSSTTASEYKKDLFDLAWDDEEEIEGLSSSDLLEIMQLLTDSKKGLADLEKAQKANDTAFTKRLNEIDKARSKVANLVHIKDGESKTADVEGSERNFSADGEAQKSVKALTVMYDSYKIFTDVATQTSSVVIESAKFSVKQSKRVFVQAAAFNPKSVKESALLVEAAGDMSDWDMDMLFDRY